ncbi:hypothetical protein [Bacillus sp. FSL K6-2944]|uniref:hypothetical protein n=1 Tax=Bacillus sp. FSL K6-2944 TaxID=2921486 RepID=UPI0030F59B4F
MVIYGKILAWRIYQEEIIFGINYEDKVIEICCYKHKILNFEQINEGKYILLDKVTNEVFII